MTQDILYITPTQISTLIQIQIEISKCKINLTLTLRSATYPRRTPTGKPMK